MSIDLKKIRKEVRTHGLSGDDFYVQNWKVGELLDRLEAAEEQNAKLLEDNEDLKAVAASEYDRAENLRARLAAAEEALGEFVDTSDVGCLLCIVVDTDAYRRWQAMVKGDGQE